MGIQTWCWVRWGVGSLKSSRPPFLWVSFGSREAPCWGWQMAVSRYCLTKSYLLRTSSKISLLQHFQQKSWSWVPCVPLGLGHKPSQGLGLGPVPQNPDGPRVGRGIDTGKERPLGSTWALKRGQGCSLTKVKSGSAQCCMHTELWLTWALGKCLVGQLGCLLPSQLQTFGCDGALVPFESLARALRGPRVLLPNSGSSSHPSSHLTSPKFFTHCPWPMHLEFQMWLCNTVLQCRMCELWMPFCWYPNIILWIR